MNVPSFLATQNASWTVSRASRSNPTPPDNDPGMRGATSLVDDLMRRDVFCWVWTACGLLLILLYGISGVEDFQQAQLSRLWLAALAGASFVSALLSNSAMIGARRYLCRELPERLRHLNADERTRRYRRSRLCGFLSALAHPATAVFAVWLLNRIKHPRDIIPPILPAIFTLGLILLAVAQLVLLACTAYGICRTTKWWEEELEDDPQLSFEEYAHIPIGYADD